MPTHKRSSETTINPPLTTIKRPKRNPQPPSLTERTNALSLPDFSAQFFSREAASASQCRTAKLTTNSVHLSLTCWTEMPASHREACLDLLQLTSSSHYRTSEMGWSRPRKTKEMRHPAMKYLLLLPEPQQENRRSEVEIEGFLSFMITEEDGYDVIYCYELHLQPWWQGKGLGRVMMEVMEGIGARVGVEKAMLTAFRANERAVRAYQRWGYAVDDLSPGARRLRDGAVREVGYVILSKRQERFAKGEPNRAGAGAQEYLDGVGREDKNG